MLSLSTGYKVRNEFFGGLLFHFNSGKIMNINRTAYLIFVALNSRIKPLDYLSSYYPDSSIDSLSKDIDSFLYTMEKRGIISENGQGIVIENEIFSNHSLASPRSIFWESSEFCNIGTCVHCYSSDKFDYHFESMSSQTLSPTENALLFQLAKYGIFSVDIGGGEPFLNKNLTTFVAEANKRLIRCNIATNLYFDQEYILQQIKKINWNYNVLQVSLDGLETLHERVRGKKGCFIKTVHNIKRILSENVPVHVNYTVMQINYEGIQDFLEFANKLGVASVRFVRVIASGNAVKNHLLISNKQYHEMCILLRQKQQEYPNLKIKLDDSFMFLDEDILPTNPRIPWLDKPYLGCGAGRTLCNVAFNGDVYPCAYIFGTEYKCGNILQEDILNIWKKSTVMNAFRDLNTLDSPCRECEVKHICLGGCRAHAIGLYHSIHGFDCGCWKDCNNEL